MFVAIVAAFSWLRRGKISLNSMAFALGLRNRFFESCESADSIAWLSSRSDRLSGRFLCPCKDGTRHFTRAANFSDARVRVRRPLSLLRAVTSKLRRQPSTSMSSKPETPNLRSMRWAY